MSGGGLNLGTRNSGPCVEIIGCGSETFSDVHVAAICCYEILRQEGRAKSMKKGEEVREENCVYSVDSYLASLPFYSMARQRVYIQNAKTILPCQKAGTQHEMQSE